MSDTKLTLVAACAFGLEALVKRELIALGYVPRVSQPGRVSFEGDWEAVCRANLWLRTADRVLVEVQRFPAPDFESLFETIKAFDYSQFIPVDAKFPVVGKTRLSKLTSLPAVQRSTKKALVESLLHFHKTTALEETGELYKVEVALLNDEATITIDTTGDSLHKRGYRKLMGPAPIKQTLAAAMVDLTVWKPERAFVDPFCGTGTIPIEAAMIGMKIAPGINRDFSSSGWHQISFDTWKLARNEARDSIDRDIKMDILAADTDEQSLDMAVYHARLAGVEQQIRFEMQPFESLEHDREYGCLVTNPPYGERLQQQEELIPLYEQFPAVMQKLPTWSLFVITSYDRFEKVVEKRATRRRKLFNGRLECMYYQFLGPRPPRDFFENASREQSNANSSAPPVADVARPQDKDDAPKAGDSGDAQKGPVLSLAEQLGATPPNILVTESAPTLNAQPATEPKPVFGGLQDKDREQSELFANRLKKKARHLRRWPTRRGITCFRIYERDIPEIPLVVDRYEDAVHITEYERPHERSLSRHSAWLQLMKTTAAKTLGVPIQQVFLKKRQKRRQGDQYEKIGDQKKMRTVSEGDLKFLINLSDYVDTGLFLDHRVTRSMVRDQAEGKSFLNLFAYTGSFTVYAADGGATDTTTVDLSKNYLSWAQDNLKLNGLDGPQHRFVSDDSTEFLEKAARDPKQRFDLVVVDPPTFSNSKRTEDDWDVQDQHVEMLGLVSQVLNPNGVVYFSTNFRKFKPRLAELSQFESIEISGKTVPEDFRNRKIHRCWKMTLTAE
jgi:23S rRNA (guanine2445-N2)-methyltransferase / 23S rRNA (guanine2069-N7)-methyltransferase